MKELTAAMTTAAISSSNRPGIKVPTKRAALMEMSMTQKETQLNLTLAGVFRWPLRPSKSAE